jgi:hypothetical protein
LNQRKERNGVRFPVAEAVVAAGAAWLVTGVAVALWFLLFQLDRRDAAARRSYAFRPLLIPGLALLWPLVLVRWHASPEPTATSRAKQRHGLAWVVLAVLLAAILALALLLRQVAPPALPSLRLSLAMAVLA